MSLAEAFGQSGFGQFMNGPAGRFTRAVVGLALIGWGYGGSAGALGVLLTLVGLILLAAGTFNFCVISALLGGPIRGSLIVTRRTR